MCVVFFVCLFSVHFSVFFTFALYKFIFLFVVSVGAFSPSQQACQSEGRAISREKGNKDQN